MTELRLNIVFHDCHFVRPLEIGNTICVKLFQLMSDVIPRNLKENGVSISNRFPEVHKRGIHTHRHTDTQTHKQTDTQTHTQTHTHTYTHTHMTMA